MSTGVSDQRFCGSAVPHARHQWKEEIDTTNMDGDARTVVQYWNCNGLVPLPADGIPIESVPPTVDKVTFHCNGGVTIELDFVTGQWTHTKQLYAIQANVITEHGQAGDRWTGSRQLPTFYLDPMVQGITSVDQARTVAASILQGALETDHKWPKIEIHVEEVWV